MTRTRALAAIAAIAGFAIPVVAWAADGDEDQSWGTGGVVYITPGAGSNQPDSIGDPRFAPLPGAGGVVAVRERTFPNPSAVRVTKLERNGEVDDSFGTNGSV